MRIGTMEELAQPARKGGQGRKVIAAAATPEQLAAASTPCRAVAITALAGNAGRVAYGMSNAVNAAAGAEAGASLGPGESVSLPVGNLNVVWLDVETNGDGVSYTYVK